MIISKEIDLEINNMPYDVKKIILDFLEHIKSYNNINYQYKGGDTLLMYASFFDLNNLVLYLINEGADPNVQDKNGWTALTYLITQNGSLDCIEHLLKNGADANLVNKNGNNALMSLLGKSYIEEEDIKRVIEIVKLLLKYGANLETVNKYGLSAFDYVKDNERILELLNSYKKDKKDLNTLIKEAEDEFARVLKM